jgi:hypothetical protein
MENFHAIAEFENSGKRLFLSEDPLGEKHEPPFGFYPEFFQACELDLDVLNGL